MILDMKKARELSRGLITELLLNSILSLSYKMAIYYFSVYIYLILLIKARINTRVRFRVFIRLIHNVLLYQILSILTYSYQLIFSIIDRPVME